MLFKARLWPRIADGSVTLAFRRWELRRARPGARHRTPAGVIEIDSVDEVEPEEIGDDDAARAGFGNRAELLATLRGDAPIHRIAFHHTGPDPRIALRERGDLSEGELAEVEQRLARLDAASRHGPWTATLLRLIAERPATRAPDLAASLGRETQPFKRDVRKLKELGLTESLEKGYRLSPRGRAVLDHLLEH